MPTRVVRVWKGYGTSGGVQRYCDDHFAKTVLPQLRALSGFESATVLVRPVGHETEVVVATVWASMQSVKTFAGDDHDAAVVEPVVRTLLDHFDTRVSHFNVALSA